jgi:hypothetical protein
MPPIPDPRVPVTDFDSDDASLYLLRNLEKKCYSDLGIHVDSESSLAEEQEPSPSHNCLARLWSSYYDSLLRRPLLVKSLTALVLMGWADLLAQAVEHLRDVEDSSDVDWLRTLRFAIFGLVGAPWTHYYYYWLDTVLPPTPEPWTMTTAGT